MLLYLMRHGIAMNRDDPGCPPDPERPLTREGIQKTREVCQGMRELGAAPDAVLTSPYLRAAQTAEIVAEILGLPREKIHKSDSLRPGGSISEFSKELTRLKAREVVCCGHAPHLDQFVARLAGARLPFTQLKKAGVACFELAGASPLRATLLWVAPPKILRSLVK